METAKKIIGVIMESRKGLNINYKRKWLKYILLYLKLQFYVSYSLNYSEFNIIIK